MPLEDPTVETGERLVFRPPRARALRLPFTVPRLYNPLSSTLFLVYGFVMIILLGTVLLALPVSSNSGEFTSPLTALFTSVSAVCVTGLVVVDTGTYWSTFGQGVLLGLFQVGGLGFIVAATLLLLAINGKFGLKERLVISESMGLDRPGGVLGLVCKVAVFALVTEAIGAAILYFYWLAAGEPQASLWSAVFLAVSAFNNCGMDIFGNFQSLAGFQTDAVVLLTTAVMIILGSTSYLVLADWARHRGFGRLSLESRLVISGTYILLALGTVFFLLAEYSSPDTLGPLPLPQKVVVAFFQSVTPRTAGLSAVDIGSLRLVTLFFTMFLMFIGGAAGSAAGGLKVNTAGVLFVTVLSVLRGRGNIEAFGRQLTKQTVFRALALLACYLGAACVVVTALAITEGFPFDSLLFETFSALGTVGLSTGITPGLSAAGQMIIVVAMFLGRLGPLALMAFLVRHQQPVDMDYPHETVRIG